MLNRIRRKLFLAIVGANALLALLTYLVISWSFDRGFIDYLNRSDQARLEPLIVELAEGYGRHGDWDWIAHDREQWRQMLRRYFWYGPRRDGADGTTDEAMARETEPLTFDPRLLLLDRQRQVLHGFPPAAERAQLKPISWRGEVVGYLGYVRREALVESVSSVFAARQDRNFAVVALAMLVTGALLAAGIAQWLSRPIRALADGTRALTQGRYDTEIKVQGRDELAQLAQDFNELAATLAANRRARQQWIADIAHELRTPLAILKGEVEALQDGVRCPDAANLASLGQEIAQLSRLVEDLRTLSLSDLGALDYRKKPLVLGELLEDVIDDHRSALEQAGINVALRIESKAVIMADDQRLVQLFTNLLQNTLRYTDAPGCLQISLRRQHSSVVLDWRDSAPGLEDKDLPHLTDRLYRVESSRGRAGGGSGLGLAIVRAVVEAHGGTLSPCHSSLGGLEWKLRFPIEDC